MQLNRMMVATPMAASLRSLCLRGADLPELPACCRQLRGLTTLDLTGWFKLTTLPEWLGQLPLEILKIINTDLTALPATFHSSTTLRCVLVYYSGLALDIMEDGEGDPPSHRMFTDASIAAVEAEIVPLSLAQPLIRFLLIQEEVRPTPMDCEIPGWNGWWHAQAGIDLRACWHAGAVSGTDDD